jgi:polygalacturonase
VAKPYPLFRLAAVVLLLLQSACMHGSASSSSTTAKSFVITDYGAVADGTTLNTAAIQKAIDAAQAAGGGTVVIPAGTFMSASLFLHQGVALYLAQGAVLLGSPRIEDYPKRQTRIEGHFEAWRMALVNAQEIDGVSITGPGRFDGNGLGYWTAFWAARVANQAVTNLAVERPRLLFIDRCQHVTIQGVTLENSGFWNLHLYRCNGVLVSGVRIFSPSNPAPARGAMPAGPRGPSTDGIDIDSSQNVTVSGCNISCADDDIALKGSKGPHADQDTDSPPVENILIENCTIGDGNGLLTCGSEATLIRHVVVRNCTLTGDATMLTLKLRPDTPQHYTDITLDGITLAGGRGRLINVAPWTQFFDLQGQPPPSRAVDHITIRNVHGTYRAFGVLHGNPGDALRDFTLENIAVTLASPALDLGATENLTVKNVVVNGQPYVPPAVRAAPARGDNGF